MDAAGLAGLVAVAVFSHYAAALVASRATALAQGAPTVTPLDPGQANATLLNHAEGTVPIDTGNWWRTDVVDYPSPAGIDELDLLVG